MIVLIRNTKGGVYESDRVTSEWYEHRMVVAYHARYDHLPRGEYTHVGIKYPDSHEYWMKLEWPTIIGFGGASPAYIEGELGIY